MSISINVHGAVPDAEFHPEGVYVLRRTEAGTPETVTVLVTDEVGTDITFFLSDADQAFRLAMSFGRAVALLKEEPVLAEAGA